MIQNPFTQTLVVNYVRYIKRDVSILKQDLDPGDYYDVEQQPATRVYRSKDNYEVIRQLGPLGSKLYLWIIHNVQSDAVTVKLNELALAELFGYSGRHVARMKSELIRAAIIAKKESNEYWINPRYFASNSRLKLYPENCVRVATLREK